MYSFEDRGGESITLRPELTAGICRAYLSEGWQQHAPLKVATHGSAFRYERPQKGRFREFHQLDAEIIGAAEPQADVELLSLGYQLLVELGIAEGVTLELNTLGVGVLRATYHFVVTPDTLTLNSPEGDPWVTGSKTPTLTLERRK
jgi:histidyl-tRNA synthetase